MTSFVGSICKAFTRKFCCCCFSSAPSYQTQEIGRFERVFPSISQEVRLTLNNINDEQFMHIPSENQIDKTINYHKDAIQLPEEDANQIETYLVELKKLHSKYSKSYSASISEVTQFSNAGSIGVARVSTLAIDKTTILKKRSPCLVIDIQRGKFFWPEELNNLERPFVRIKIVSITPPKTRVSSELSQTSQVSKTYETLPAPDNVNPQWNQCFAHAFNENENYQNENQGFKISLVYQKLNSGQIQIGSEQTFYLRDLIDQQMKTKEVSFKHEKSMGLIAKIAIRVQFVYDETALAQDLLQAMEYRMGQLSAIKKKHPDVFRQMTMSTGAISYTDREIRDNGTLEGSFNFDTGLILT